MAGKKLTQSESFWRQEFADQEITCVLARLRDVRKIDASQSVSIAGLSLDDWLSFLVSAMSFDVRTDALKRNILQRVVFSPDLNEEFSEKDFRAACQRLKNVIESENQRPFYVVFPVWNKPKFLPRRSRQGSAYIEFQLDDSSRLMQTIARERAGLMSKWEYGDYFSPEKIDDLEKCELVRALVRGSNVEEAYEIASEALYFELGLVNLARDRLKSGRMSSRAQGKLPISDVLIGPFVTVHTANGRLATEGFWYEQWVGGPQKKSSEEAMAKWGEVYDKLSASAKNSRWSDMCRFALSSYFKAFSNPNLQESFLEGWRLLERICGRGDERSDVILDRASSAFHDHVYARAIGKHLRFRRNAISHGKPVKIDDFEGLSFEMLRFIIPVLYRFIFNPYGASSLPEFWEFIGTSAAASDRKEEAERIKRRLRILDKVSSLRKE